MLSHKISKLLLKNLLLFTYGLSYVAQSRDINEFNGDIRSVDQRKVVILNTIDGSFVGINASTGDFLWQVNGPPLISQSLSDLKLFLNNVHFTVVPSLDGHLYMLKRDDSYSGTSGPSLKALPLTIDGLLNSNFMLTHDSILTGGRDTSVFAFNPLNGQIKYNCTRDGCFGASTDPGHSGLKWLNEQFSLLAHQSNDVVRAVHLPSGLERWNLSVRQYDLCTMHSQPGTFYSSVAIQAKAPKCDASTSKTKGSANDHHALRDSLNFNLFFDGSVLKATSKTPIHSELWTYRLSSRLIKVWLFSAESGEVVQLPSFTSESQSDSSKLQPVSNSNTAPEPPRVSNSKMLTKFFAGLRYMNSLHRPPPADRVKQRCPSLNRVVYLGSLDGQLYVHVEDDKGSLPNSINLSEDCDTNASSAATVDDSPDSGETSRPNTGVLTGYYRATYTSPSDNPVCQQPFLTSSASADERGLVPWSPLHAGYPWDNIDCRLSGESVPGGGGGGAPSTDDRQSHMTDWVVDSASHLIMLLMRANDYELSRPSSERQPLLDNESSPVGQFVQLLAMLAILFCTYWYAVSVQQRKEDVNGAVANEHTAACFAAASDDAEQGPSSNQDSSSPPASSGGTSVQHSPVIAGNLIESTYLSTFEGEFKFIRCLGRGGFGQVFEVENRFDGCRYAIKRIPVKETGEEEKKFLREVKALASLDHPGIVRYHRAWSESPPLGWQKARDLVLLGEDSTITEDYSCTELSSSQTLDRHQLSDIGSTFNGGKTNCTESSNLCKQRMNLPDDDSLIVFEHETNGSAYSASCCSSTQSQQLHDSSSSSSSERGAGGQSVAVTTTYLYIQMQLCSQTSLRDWLQARNTEGSRPGKSVTCDMFRQVVDAVAYLHDRCLMHRDLKPSNILFDAVNPNRLKLADFGLVTSTFRDEEEARPDELASQKTSSSNPRCVPTGDRSGHGGPARRLQLAHRHTDNVGTGLYMSPEQDRGERYDHKVDIFSLGLIYLELRVFFGTAMERVQCLIDAKSQRLPAGLVKDHPEETTFLLRMLAVCPSVRPTASQLLEDPLLQS